MKLLILSLLISFSISDQCEDRGCISCNQAGDKCFRCISGFKKHYFQCGKTDCSIKNCKLCNYEGTGCIKCKGNCKFNGEKCNCTERYVLIVVLSLFSCAVIGILIYCLSHNFFARKANFRAISIFNNRNNQNINVNESAHNITQTRLNENDLIDSFIKYKINVCQDIESKKCEFCNNALCNLHLGCGCFVCFECEKKMIERGKCLVCRDKVNSMQQVSCSICFMNKKEISIFNCQCKLIVCKECYIKWRLSNNLCPVCRTEIL